MSSRGVGIGTKGGITLAATLAAAFGIMMAGCEDPPEVKASPFIEKAGVILAKASPTAQELDDAEAAIAEAVKLWPEADVSALNDKIAVARKALATAAVGQAEADRLAALDTKLTDASAKCGQKDFDDAIAVCDEVLAAKPSDAQAAKAKQIKATCVAGKLPAKPTDAENYAKIKREFDAAMARKSWSTAKAKVREIAQYVGAGRRSLQDQLPKIESREVTDRAKPLMRSSSRATLERAQRLLEDATRKDRTNSEARQLLATVKDKIAKLAGGAARDREIKTAMDNGKRALDRQDLATAEREYRKAEGKATGYPKTRASAALRMVKQLRDLQGAMKAGDSAMARDDLAKAASEYTRASRIYITGAPSWARNLTRTARGKADTVEAKNLANQGETAFTAGDYEKAADLFGRSISKARNANVSARRDEALAMGKKGDAAAQAKAAIALSKSDWGRAAPILKRFADAGDAACAAALKAGPSKEQKGKIDAAAMKVYNAAYAAAKKQKGKLSIIAGIWRDALPKVTGSKYQKLAEKNASKATDAILKGKFMQVQKAAKAMKTPGQQITYLEPQVAQFKGSSFEKTITGMIQKAKDTRAGGAYAKVSARVKAAKTAAAKIAAIDAGLMNPDIKGTKYEGTLQGARKKERDNQTKAPYTKLSAKLKGIKAPQAKLAAIQAAVADPTYVRTSYVDKWNAEIKKIKDTIKRGEYTKVSAKAKKLKGQAQISYYESQVSNFTGTSFEKTIKDAVQKEKDAIKAAQFKKDGLAAKKVKDKVAYWTGKLANYADSKKYSDTIKATIEKEKTNALKGSYAGLTKKVKTAKTPDLKIAMLEGALPKYRGTSFEKSITAAIQKEKDAQLAGDYKKDTTKLKTIKDPNQKISMLESMLGKYAASARYKGMVQKSLTTEKTNIKKSLYTKLMQDAAIVKDPQAKLSLFQGRAGDFVGTTYAKSLKTQIDKLQKQIDAASKKPAPKKKPTKAKRPPPKPKAKKPVVDKKAKAAKDAAAKKDYDAVMKAINAKPKKKAVCDDNIAKLQEAKLKVEGTRYVALIDRHIKKFTAAKKRLK